MFRMGLGLGGYSFGYGTKRVSKDTPPPTKAFALLLSSIDELDQPTALLLSGTETGALKLGDAS
ncbi:hypothetical protein M2281_005774 [Mesorhizobium soli]|uniref:hypothetical protein n=1 Tax=Pseudaminobacter soli (ex Li et al. 2025) TaxID=1295366 RepID=UPI0024756FCB|nr:hypothetical protein [Mesorhizobium soli]MDH6235152.1 hypothetical protein [Mesorhizobium soli]